MAYVNVRDWSVDQVVDWLKGLDTSILHYTTTFLNNGVTGHHLLNLRAEDLGNLGMKTLGHQEIILESVEHLRHFHFELDKENLQLLALKVSCASNSLYKELLLVDDDCPIVSLQMMSDVHNIIATIKPLVCWLDRAPFLGDKDYIDCKTQLLDLSFEMATRAHRGKFSEKPVSSIRKICEKITKLADHIIQEISDPMILQPASLDLATLKKKEQELGFFISPNNHPVHQIAEIKYGSPAHGSTKIEAGDEIVQVNYQTVVGWQRKNVMILLQDSPPEIVLTLKKRPRHTKVYGQIYMKPYRLPSKKLDNQAYFRWNDNIPAPRLLPIHNLSPITIPKLPAVIEPPDVETELSSSDDSEPPDSPLDGSGRMYPLKPRPILQRRNTITGATPTSKRPYPSVEQYWQIWKDRAVSTHSSSYNIDDTNFESASNFLRDKSASCNLGLELSPRPTTVIGLGQNRNKNSFKNDFKDKCTKKKVNFQEKRHEDHEKKDNLYPSNLNDEKSVSVNSLASLTNENIAFIDEGRELTDRTSMVTENDDIKKDCELFQNTHDRVRDAALAEVKIHDIIRKFDEQQQEMVVKPKIYPRSQIKKPPDVPQKPDGKKPVVPPRSVSTKIRGRLDKSHSTPAYDLTGDENSPVEKFVVEKTQPEIIDDQNAVIPEIKPEIEPFTETKYELGIPIIEAINLPLTQIVPIVEEIKCIVTTQVVEKPTEIKETIDPDLPPKPPPRTFGVVDLNKPAYPIDSPKPNILEKFRAESSYLPPKSTVFEFPETRHQSTVHTVELTTTSITLKPPESPASFKLNTESNKLQNKYFEPKIVSTPKGKGDYLGENETVAYKSSPSFEVQKSMSDSKISPTNSIVRAMIYSNKNKVGKKKNTIAAKRRKVSVNDLNPADFQGFLYQRLRSKHNQNIHWEKRWFVLLGSCLYGFKTKEDPRAACLIFLSGFTVAVANEVKSRSNAFKVYHTGTVFYFSAEDPETLQSWIEMITAATLNNECLKITDGSLYSETDESDSEKPKKVETEKTESIKKFGSLKKLTSKKHDAAGGSTSLDRKRFFNKSSSHSKNSLPVPTAQFRSYRKIKTNDAPGSVTTGNFTSHVAFFAPRSEIPKLQHSVQNVSVPNLTVEQESEKAASAKLSKVKPLNYVHASNPSLCNINDFNVPNFPKKGFKREGNDNLAGFVTLEELMIKQSEERKSNPYNMGEDILLNLNLIKPDVVYGEVPIRPKEKIEVEERPEPTYRKGHSRNASDSQKSSEKQDLGSSCFGKRLGSLKKIQKANDEYENRTATYPKVAKGFDQKLNRSLPRTHKLPEKPDSTNRYASDRNLSGGDRGYEMIYCPETTTDIQFAQNRNLDDRMYKETPKRSYKIRKQNSFSSSDKKSSKSCGDATRYTNKVSDSSKVKLKSALQYTPMCLPLSQDQKTKPKLAFELNLDDKGSKSGKLKQIFGKQNEAKKEKTFLGSPKLHRTIFRKNNSGTEISWPSSSSPPVSISQSSYSLESSPPSSSEPLSISISPHADYPGLEYPPVFEPETYSLADPQSSLTLLRKQGKSNN